MERIGRKMDTLTSIKMLHSMFMLYRGDMKNIWEEYTFLSVSIKNIEKEGYKLKSLVANDVSDKTVKDAGGMQTRFLSGGNTRNHYIDAICVFENYINRIVTKVYHDYPFKMQGIGMDAQKLFSLVLKKESKEDILDSIIEEKVRSIFYGNPVDIFEKDKCKLELGTIFKDKYADAMKYYTEIVGRRNVLIHNSGIVDNKFLKENPNFEQKKGHKIIISEDYLRGSISLLIGIAAILTQCVIENIYSGNVQGKLGSAVASFDRCIQNKWYQNLLQ